MDFRECDTCPEEGMITMFDGRVLCDNCYEAETEPDMNEEW